jgi:hypothetical protein
MQRAVQLADNIVGLLRLYSLSALEGLLLLDTSEPIQQNLGERLAFLLGREPVERQEIVTKRARGLRHKVSLYSSPEICFRRKRIRAILPVCERMSVHGTSEHAKLFHGA